MRSLDNIHDGDWALYAGIEFGNSEYPRKPDSLIMTASCGSSGGVVEVWLDSLDSGTKIAECSISGTGSWDVTNIFTTNVLQPVSGNHDVYLKFRGKSSDRLFILQWLTFVDNTHVETSVGESEMDQIPSRFDLDQNYPNPFNPTTAISYQLSALSSVSLTICDLLGRNIATLVNGEQVAGRYTVRWDGKNELGEGVSSGIYLCQLRAGSNIFTRKMVLVK